MLADDILDELEFAEAASERMGIESQARSARRHANRAHEDRS